MKRCIFQAPLVALCFIALLVSSCKKDESTSEPVHSRGELASYQLRSNLSASALKTALSLIYPDVVSQINFECDIDLYKIRYYTLDPQDKVVLASGLMVVPKKANGTFPLLAYFHGTSLQRTDVPSNNSSEAFLGYTLGTEGYICVLPDYLGLGDSPGMHPYIHAKSEAISSIDMILVCKNLCKTLNISINNQLFLCGYSQGGHVTMAVQKMIEEQYASQLPITASAPMAGPYDVSGVQKNALLSAAAYPAPVYLPYLFYAYHAAYQLYPNMAAVFQANYSTIIPSYFTSSGFDDLTGLAAKMPSSNIPSDVLQPSILQAIQNDPTNAMNVALKENDLYDWAPKSPMKLCHCDGDLHVPMANSLKAVESFNAKGVNVELVNPLSHGTHASCILPSFIYMKNWFASLKK